MPYGPFRFSATRGLSLFSNRNTKLAVLGVTKGHVGMKLGRIGPWPLPEVPYGLLSILANRWPSLFCNLNAKLAFLGILRSHIGMKLGRFGPWP